jgi:hypothetical protein
MRRKTKTKPAKRPQQLGLVWWVFKLKSGEIKKHYGNDLRNSGDALEVWNDHGFIGAVLKDDIVDRWAQDREFTDRENQ